MTDQAKLKREFDRQLSLVLEGICPTCVSGLEAGICNVCGLRYEATVQGESRRFRVTLADEDDL